MELYAPQLFIYRDGFIITDDMVCLDPPEIKLNTTVRIMACNTLERQKWKYDKNNGQIQHGVNGDLCLDLVGLGDRLILNLCDNKEKSQKWKFEDVQWNDSVD